MLTMKTMLRVLQRAHQWGGITAHYFDGRHEPPKIRCICEPAPMPKKSGYVRRLKADGSAWEYVKK